MKDVGRLEIANFKSETAEINAVRLHYWLGGNLSGTPLLLWHGFLGTSHSGHKVMPILAEAGFAVLVPDMRGYGDSDKPPGTEGYDGRALAEEFRQLVKHIGFGGGRPVVIVAHDLGAPPALLWAADHPAEIAGLMYMECPVMLAEVLMKAIAYTPEAMTKRGPLWWWILPFAPDVPERLIVGNERAFLTWFYERATVNPSAFDAATVDEYLRTFSGREGVLGALGPYRAAFTTIGQTTPLMTDKVKVPIVALGAEKAQGDLRNMLEFVADNVGGGSIPNCGHFIPEERPNELVSYIKEFVSKVASAYAVDHRDSGGSPGRTSCLKH